MQQGEARMAIKRKRFVLGFILAAFFIGTITAGAYYTAQKRILSRAQQDVEHLILSHRGLHHYIQRVMHPAFFKAIDEGHIVKNYYAPEIFSSTYIVRTMHGFHNEELAKHGLPQLYYKLATENPRNPVNKADERESKLLKMFNENRNIKKHSEIITVDGKKFLHYSIPFLENTKLCLRCHGKREDAPIGLQALYPGSGGFNEKVGQIRAIESIRAPLAKEYQTIYAFYAAVGAAALCFFGLFWFSTRLRTEVAIKTENLEEELSARKEAENELRIQAAMLEQEIAERQKTHEDLCHAKEVAEAANKAKSLFLANMSHELRTPLNGVVGMAQLLSMSGVTEEQKEYLDTLQYSADNLIALISDILDITKIEAEKFEIHHDRYSIRSCIDEVIMMQRTKIHEKNLQIDKYIPENIPDMLTGDRIRVLQVLSNLLSNAVKFTDRGSIKISITVKERYESTILLDISVADTGIGIEPALMGYIFNMFSQADESYTRRHGGAGLGLAISKRLAELMGGSIEVESVVNVGSTFHLILPFTVPSQPNNSDHDPCKPIEATSRPLSVLLAEDNLANSVYAQKLLTKLGHTVIVAADGEKALQEWEQGNFDLILMDIQMPKMNGDEVVKIIRQREVDKHTPIIAVTAHAVIGDQKRLLEAGCDGYVSKPFTLETLVSEIKRVVD